MQTVTRAVVFDVGETLIDETNAWERVARAVGVPPFMFMATLGGVIARGEHHRRVFDLLRRPAMSIDFTEADFYPDALRCLHRLRQDGYFVAIVGNTERSVEDALRPHAHFVASSAQWGLEKPSAAFFERVIAECGRPAGEIAYVGDRVDNDVAPALAAGLVAIHIRRGPWAHLQYPPPGTISIDTLDELPAALS
jgi:FMN phosphatase YigB (HAD superfamily)